MYQVLLVDDEPIILSGIKFLIDWPQEGCEIMGTARNGQQALDFIAQHHPDIVVCDITMPVLSGLAVLRALADSPDAPVFIMLTNHSDFTMAQEALRLRAVDYVLKTQLEAEHLQKSLALAIAKCEEQRKLARVRKADTFMQANRANVLGEQIRTLLSGREGPYSKDALDAVRAEGAFTAYFIVQIMMDFTSGEASGAAQNLDERKRLFDWERELVEKLAGNVFFNSALFDPDLHNQSLTLYVWQFTSGQQRAAVSQFFTKLVSATANITQLKLSILSTSIFSGEEAFPEAFRQLIAMREYYMHTGTAQIYGGEVPALTFTPLDVSDICNKLVSALRAKDVALCAELFDKAHGVLSEGAHRWSGYIAACSELYSVTASGLSPLLSEASQVGFFADSAEMLQTIRRFQTRREALLWLSELRRQTLVHLEQLTSARSNIAQSAQQYIVEHADKRIMLQDVADHVNISPSYLPALFKKAYGQNLVDFINQTKVQRACELIREGKYRIYEISYMLSFENAYYFTKVFKKHTGCTPTEYQRREQGPAQ